MSETPFGAPPPQGGGQYGPPAQQYGPPPQQYGAPPPQYGAPYGSPYGAPYPPVVRRRRRWPYFLALGLVLFFGAIGGVIYAVYKTQLAPAREAVDHYFGDLAAGDDTSAYGLLCRSQTSQASNTLANFKEAADAKPVKSWSSSGVNVSSSTGAGTTGSVTGTVTYKDGTTKSGTVTLTKESGSWKVCGGVFLPTG